MACGPWPSDSSLAALVLYGARWLSLDARWFDDARRAALGTCGTLCRIVSDGPDRVIVEVAGAQPGGPATPAGRVRAIKHACTTRTTATATTTAW